MRAAYVTTYDASDVGQWSGSGYHIARALEREGIELAYVGPLREKYRLLHRAAQRLHNRSRSSGYSHARSPAVLRGYAEQVAARLRELEVDLVFSPGSLPVAYLDSDRPIAFWTDATFAGMVDFYPGYMGLSARAIREGNAAESAALERCRLALYTSEWAARSAIDVYGVDAKKVRVIPFGGNFEFGGTAEKLARSVAARPVDRCRLLFVGVEWWRKGGDVALEAARLLNERGLPTELTVIGCEPPAEDAESAAHVRLLGFLSKAVPEEAERLRRELLEAHFLILPTRAECYGMVLSEAASFGVPALTTAVGGIAEVVADGVNGRLFPAGTPAAEYASFVRETMANPDGYRELAIASAREHAARLNWVVAGARARAELERIVR